MDQLVRAFCEAYEKANSTSDFVAMGDLYAETFLFSGPDAVRSVRREDFLKVIPRMKARFAALGLTSTRLLSVEATNLDSRHVLARVGWTMTLRTASGAVKTFDAFATYILRRGDHERLSIVFQLDHQDLATVLSRATQSSCDSASISPQV
jgi:hypothetical protein